MQHTELTEIEASLQKLVRRAYDLGRNDALQKVVAVLNGDNASPEPLALTGPDRERPAEAPHQDMNGRESASGDRPWWAWRVR